MDARPGFFPARLFPFAHTPFSLLSAPEYCLSGKGGELVLRTYTPNLAGSVDRGRDFARLPAGLKLDVVVFQEASPLFLKVLHCKESCPLHFIYSQRMVTGLRRSSAAILRLNCKPVTRGPVSLRPMCGDSPGTGRHQAS